MKYGKVKKIARLGLLVEPTSAAVLVVD